MKKSVRILAVLILISFGISNMMAQSCCAKSKNAGEDQKLTLGHLASTEYKLQDQDGKMQSLKSLIADKVVVMNFVFTTCKTICPPMGANLVALKNALGERVKEDFIMLSISLDPATDTPERLKQWQVNFDSNSDGVWTMLTGEKSVVDQLLKDLNVFTPLKEEHAPIMLIGNAGNDEWIRTNGLASPDVLSSKVIEYLDEAKREKQIKRDLKYFTDLPLINQHGEEYNFYSDLLKDKVVFINPFFAECPGTCPIMHTMMQEVQSHLGDRLGESVLMLSITVDPVNDSPEVLKEYAARYGAKEGWHFLTGNVENVHAVMKKIGKYVRVREQHDTIVLIGNLKTQLWKKANGLAETSEIIEVLESVIDDLGDTE